MGLLQWMHRLVGGAKGFTSEEENRESCYFPLYIHQHFFPGLLCPRHEKMCNFHGLKTPTLPLRCIHFNQFHFISYGAIGNGGFTHLLHTSSKGWRELRMHELWMHALPTDYAEHKNLLQKSLPVQQSSAYAGQKGKKAINPEASLTLPLESKVLFIVKIPSCKP